MMKFYFNIIENLYVSEFRKKFKHVVIEETPIFLRMPTCKSISDYCDKYGVSEKLVRKTHFYFDNKKIEMLHTSKAPIRNNV